MRITVTTTPTLLSELITTAGYDLSDIADSRADIDGGTTSFWFDLTDATASVRFEFGVPTPFADCVRLDLFPSFRAIDPNKVYLVADANEPNVLVVNA